MHMSLKRPGIRYAGRRGKRIGRSSEDQQCHGSCPAKIVSAAMLGEDSAPHHDPDHAKTLMCGFPGLYFQAFSISVVSTQFCGGDGKARTALSRRCVRQALI